MKLLPCDLWVKTMKKCGVSLFAVSVRSYKTIYNLYAALWGHVFKMASQAATCMPSSNLRCNKGQRSGQVHYILLPREAYYSSQVSRICVASV